MKPVSLSVEDVTYEQLAGTIDHSLLKPMLTVDEIIAGCKLAADYKVVSVCVRPADVALAASELEGTNVAVGTVISFPHGDSKTSIKVAEAEQARADGAVELDMVLNIGRLRSGLYDEVQADIAAVVAASGDALVKVIFENSYLTDEEKITACHLCEAAGADYVKTSTGYAPTGATIEDLRLMKANIPPGMKVKAAHGVRTLDALLAVIEAGAERCGATATAVMLDDYLERTGQTRS
jgi:deoxyribose-phosphate aldolase